MKSVLDEANERSVVSPIGGMQLVYNNFFEEYKAIVDKQRRGRTKGKGIRWITSIDKDSVELVKIFLDAGIQIRHIKNLTPMNFAVDDRYFYATIDKMKNGSFTKSLLTSNEPAYITHYNSIFEELWKNGIDATERIRDIEAGVDLADIEVILSSARAQELYLDIVKSASEEILLIFPSINAFIRQEKIGAIQLAEEAAKERNVKIRILVPRNGLVEQKVQQLKQCSYPNDIIDVRYIVQMSETKATLLVVDRKASLVMEIKDDSKTTFTEAIGLSTYSNSKAGVLSYVAIFENLWVQSDLYEQLKIHNKMQKEFINIAAHELRTPTQPILIFSDVLLSKKGNIEEYRELLEAIVRNAKRLQRLTDDILDVTKIESKALNLNKERFNLNDVIYNVIKDLTNHNEMTSSINNRKLKLAYDSNKLDIFVDADKQRITRVVYNLLNNAIKFTQEGTIYINLERKKEDANNNGYVVISVKDTGQGINPEILAKLFTKFATKSEAGGSGLGLFISKSIVEAHGGRIWAENNAGGKGATFSFSLPIVNK
jgi:two-component system, OmpR family, sensor histidine kinase VicK